MAMGSRESEGSGVWGDGERDVGSVVDDADMVFVAVQRDERQRVCAVRSFYECKGQAADVCSLLPYLVTQNNKFTIIIVIQVFWYPQSPIARQPWAPIRTIHRATM